ncbi:DUF362 domain-containing protein [Clostridiaceae bacterium M8S5]|nr:DUF362 domain-containing protein [Clostridiaceae bacterium M8S5]
MKDKLNNKESIVALVQNDNESTAVLDALEKINAKDIINTNDVVVITPNWVNNKKNHASDAIVVGAKTLKTIIRYVKNLNPKRIIVATGSGSVKTHTVMKEVGYDEIIKSEDVEFIDLNNGPFIEVELNHDNPKKTKINKLIEEMTVLISFTQLKHHEEATMSASIKNIALGWPPAEIHGYPKKNLGIHDDLHSFITAMTKILPIDISIVSANPAMIGSGPSNGIARHTGIVICGNDAIATDTIGARLLGFKPQAIHYLYNCSKLKLGESNLDNIILKGMTIAEGERAFSKKVYGDIVVIDK